MHRDDVLVTLETRGALPIQIRMPDHVYSEYLDWFQIVLT